MDSCECDMCMFCFSPLCLGKGCVMIELSKLSETAWETILLPSVHSLTHTHKWPLIYFGNLRENCPSIIRTYPEVWSRPNSQYSKTLIFLKFWVLMTLRLTLIFLTALLQIVLDDLIQIIVWHYTRFWYIRVTGFSIKMSILMIKIHRFSLVMQRLRNCDP